MPRVLVVDDNDANRLLVVETLTGENIEVVEAVSGEAAIEAFQRARFDVVLLDVRMPGLDGFATLARLRALPLGEDVPVVFLTALRDVDTFDRARAAGAADFLTKPIRPTELLVRVDTLFRMRQLGGEVRAQLEEIRRQRDDLMRLHLQKERLSAFVIHDLKNPLASMRLHADLLLRDSSVSGDAKESALAVREQCDRLQHLILNLLDLSKADEGRMGPVLSDVSIDEVFCSVVTSLAVQAQERGVRLEAHREEASPDGLRVDLDLFRRILDNLVENALRHSPKGSAVTLSAAGTPTHAEIRIVDQGAGIPPALLERIFDPFTQGETKGASRSGRGLGLSFCKMAVLAHGGSIEAVPAARGAVFLVRLPRAGVGGSF